MKPIPLRPLHSTYDHPSDCCIYLAVSLWEGNFFISFVNGEVKYTDLIDLGS